MAKKLKYSFIILFFLGIVSYGFIKTSSELPDFIKDRSDFKVSLNSSPFDLRLEMENYIVYINDKLFLNIKNGTAQVLKHFSGKDSGNVNNSEENVDNSGENVQD